MLPNGKVLFAASAGAFHAPVNYFEYDPVANSFAAVSQEAGVTSFQVNFVILPTSQILKVNTDNSLVQVYNANPNTFAANLQPVVSSVPNCIAPGGTYVASGTQFNGLSEGENYGDEGMANTNFPLVRIRNNATGHIFYARTFSHSSRSIAPGVSTSTSFKVAAATEGGTSTLFVVANGIPSAGKTITVSSTCTGALAATHDFNGDAKSDILWRHSGGDVAMWFMNGTSLVSGPNIGNVNTGWQIAGTTNLVRSTGDFNGDGKADILWRHSGGDVAIWLMDGPTLISGPDIANVDTSWQIVGSGDFDGDGKSDILWRHSGGDVAIWFMNGTSLVTGPNLGNVNTSWQIVGIGDFNGDGKSDIVWRHSGGDVAIWLMNGPSILSGPDIANVSTTWQIVGTGDFDGDGKSDILWRHSGGDVAIWFMNGTSLVSGPNLGNVGTGWQIVSTGDYNGDGKSDILWRYSGGDVAIWLMNGTSLLSGPNIANVSPTWTIVE
jgi:hypothetical protein